MAYRQGYAVLIGLDILRVITNDRADLTGECLGQPAVARLLPKGTARCRRVGHAF